MWISRVDEVENNNDKVQLSNPFMMQNNMDHLRSPLNAGHASSGRAKANAVSPAGNDIGESCRKQSRTDLCDHSFGN